MLVLVRPVLRKWCLRYEKAQGLPPESLAATLMLFLAAVWFTDRIGMHAIFGGFILGAVMPRGALTRTLKAQVEPFTTVFLLPVFFTYSGLQTRLNLISTPSALLISLVVIAAACLGKGGACWAAARLNGEDNRTALGVAALMNSRGLMELILVNIGLEKGIIQPTLFAMLVLMTIATTLMATPLFEWVYGRHARRQAELQTAPVSA